MALGVFITADKAHGNAFLPDCSESQSTNCIVSTELNGAPTQAIKAWVRVGNNSAAGKLFSVSFTNFHDLWTRSCSTGGLAEVVFDDEIDTTPSIFCADNEGYPEPPTEPHNDCFSPKPTIRAQGARTGRGETRLVPFCADLTHLTPVAPGEGPKVGVTVNLGPDEPKFALIRGGKLGDLDAPNRTWTSETTANGTVVKLEIELTTSSRLYLESDPNPCSVFPVVKDCGGPNAVASWTGTQAGVSLWMMDGSLIPSQVRETIGGTTIAHNASDDGPPITDSAKRTMAFRIAAPHFQSNGTLNRGYVESYLPNSLLESRFGVPPDRTPEEMLAMLGMDKTTGSSKETLTPIITRGQGGVFYSAEFGYSSPLIEYVPRQGGEPPATKPPATNPPAGGSTPKVTVTRKKVSVTLEVGGKSTVSVAGRIGHKAICKGTKAASKAGSVTVSCKLSRPGKKVLKKAKKGSRVNVKLAIKATGRKAEVKNAYGLVP